MNIIEEQIKGLDNNPAKFKHNKYPVPNHPKLQNPYFISLFCGARNSGKTYGICKLISSMEKYKYHDPDNGENVPIRTILFSPTVEANKIFTSLKSLD